MIFVPKSKVNENMVQLYYILFSFNLPAYVLHKTTVILKSNINMANK